MPGGRRGDAHLYVRREAESPDKRSPAQNAKTHLGCSAGLEYPEKTEYGDDNNWMSHEFITRLKCYRCNN